MREEQEEKHWRKENRAEVEDELTGLTTRAKRKGSSRTAGGIMTGATVFCSWQRKLPGEIAQEIITRAYSWRGL